MSEMGEAPGRLRRALPQSRRGRVVLISALVLVLAAAGLGTWAADIWPPKERYCWGAWEEDSGPEFLGDGAFREGDGPYDGSRTAKETAPTHRRPAGSCEITIASNYRSEDDNSKNEKVSINQQVSVAYGPVPKAMEARLAKVQDGFLGGDMVSLPDGLPGTVNGNSGLLVLPKSCDTRDGRPTVITMKASGTYSSGGSHSNDPVDMGGAREAAVLLVAVANRGMAAAGCAPDEPLRTSSPLYGLPGGSESVYSSSEELCGVRGLRLGTEKGEQQIGVVTRDVQTCSVRRRLGGLPYLELAMVAQPRLAALFEDVAGEGPVARGWRGTGTLGEEHALVRADCAGRPTTFLMGASTDSGRLATFANAVAARLGCAPIAPKGAVR